MRWHQMTHSDIRSTAEYVGLCHSPKQALRACVAAHPKPMEISSASLRSLSRRWCAAVCRVSQSSPTTNEFDKGKSALSAVVGCCSHNRILCIRSLLPNKNWRRLVDAGAEQRTQTMCRRRRHVICIFVPQTEQTEQGRDEIEGIRSRAKGLGMLTNR